MQVILISGTSGTGKDTFAELLRYRLMYDGHKVQILHNADPAKLEILEKYGIYNHKTPEGKKRIMQVTDENYAKDRFYFEKLLSEKIKKDTEYVIIPDWRYVNTYEYFKDYDILTIMLTRKEYSSYINSNEDNKKKEEALIHDLGEYINHTLNLDCEFSKEVSIIDVLVKYEIYNKKEI